MISLIKLLLERESPRKKDVKNAIKTLEKEISSIKGIDEIELDYDDFDNVLTIEWIDVKPKYRGQGIATTAINKIIMLADRFGLDIELIPEPEPGYSKSKLISYYNRFGFVVKKNTNLKFTMMVRKYKKER